MAFDRSMRGARGDLALVVLAGLALGGLTLAALSTSRVADASGAAKRPGAASSVPRPGGGPDLDHRIPAATDLSVIAGINQARSAAGSASVTRTGCADSAAMTYADSLPPVLQTSQVGWSQGAAWCQGRELAFGYQRGVDRSGTLMAATAIASGKARACLIAAGDREFGYTVRPDAGAAAHYVLVWTIG